ncbi:alcohol dehydrogenase, partial [Candidatus Marinimicrobia bacterium MT.SAG.2]
VYTTSSSDEKLEKAAEIGADFTINYDKESFQDLIYKDTDGEGVDIVIEHIGPATWKDSIRSLKKGGRLVTCGATTGPIAELDLRRIFSRQISIHGSYMGYLSELNDVLRYINSGALKPVVDSVFDLKDAPDAHRHMENRNQFGKIILNP